MRKKNNGYNVRPITTGHPEADMLGQVYLWISERQNSKNAHRLHRKKLKGYTFLSRSEVSNMIRRKNKSIFRVVLETIQTAPTACWRRLKAWQDKKDAQVPRYLSGVRKQKRNGN